MSQPSVKQDNGKIERELVLEKESTMRISTKRKGVCETHERRRETERETERE